MTATSPYIFMLILLIRNSLLDGAADGVEFYLNPNMTKLGEMQVSLLVLSPELKELFISVCDCTLTNTFPHGKRSECVTF